MLSVAEVEEALVVTDDKDHPLLRRVTHNRQGFLQNFSCYFSSSEDHINIWPLSFLTNGFQVLTDDYARVNMEIWKIAKLTAGIQKFRNCNCHGGFFGLYILAHGLSSGEVFMLTKLEGWHTLIKYIIGSHKPNSSLKKYWIYCRKWNWAKWNKLVRERQIQYDFTIFGI